MKPQYFDIHSHSNFPDYGTDQDAVLERMKENNVWTITVGTNFESSKSAVELTQKQQGLFASIGLHPVDDPSSTFDLKAFETLASHPKVVAIGECGLDYGRTGSISEEDKKRQKRDFEAQIDFAVKHNKALMLHVRNAHDDVLDILYAKKHEFGDALHGNCHFFSGSTEILKRYLDLNFTASFTGVITFAKEYAETVAYIPLNMLMTETDAPFVAPVPYRGKRNEPSYVSEVVKKVAKIKKLPFEEVKQAVVDNALRVFSITA